METGEGAPRARDVQQGGAGEQVGHSLKPFQEA